jgi:hypothetical protein
MRAEEDRVFAVTCIGMILVWLLALLGILMSRPEPDPEPPLSYCWGGYQSYLPCKDVPYMGKA